MTLKAQIAAGVMRAFMTLKDGEIARDLTYVRVTGQPIPDIEAGTPIIPSVNIPVPMAVFVRMKHDELGDDIAAQNDQKVIFPLVYLPADWEINEADYILDRKGRHWEIKKYMGEPSETVFIAQVRD